MFVKVIAIILLLSFSWVVECEVDTQFSTRGDSSAGLTVRHLRSAISYRRNLKGGKQAKKGAGKKKAKKDGSNKTAGTGTTTGGGSAASSGFVSMSGLPILGQKDSFPTTWNPKANTSPGNTNDENLITANKNGEDEENDNDSPDLLDSIDEANRNGNDERGDCTKSIPTLVEKGNPAFSERCRASCECSSDCCIPYHSGTCAPKGRNRRSRFGGGYMRCV